MPLSFQCSVYPFLTIVCSTILRKETQAIVATLRARVIPAPVSRARRVEPEVCVVARGRPEAPGGIPRPASSPSNLDSRNLTLLAAPDTCVSGLASSVFPEERAVGSSALGLSTISFSERIPRMSAAGNQRPQASPEGGGDAQPESRRLEVRARGSGCSSPDEDLASSS